MDSEGIIDQLVRERMGREEIVARYLDAFNRRDVADLLRIMHPDATYYDAFWQETCRGRDIGKYITTFFEEEIYWYKPCEELISLPDGVIIRYQAFRETDELGLEPIYSGAEIVTLLDDLIHTISDHYCDPSRAHLIEVAKHAEDQHRRANATKAGLGARGVARIQRELIRHSAGGSPIILDSTVTVTKLAADIGCEVKHLFHVLEKINGTTFLDFVNECRSRHASTLIVDSADGVRFDKIAEECGFESVKDMNVAFEHTFGMGADAYKDSFGE